MAKQRGGESGPFEGIDSKLTIYALANGMDLAKEPGVRRLGWYRDGREREVRIAARGGGFALTASAWKTSDAEDRHTAPLGEVGSAPELLERLSAFLEEGQERANGL